MAKGNKAAARETPAAAPEMEASQQVPTLEEKAAAQNETNLAKAVSEGGYEEPAPPSIEERKAALIADMEHAVQHNGPITILMLRELRELLAPAAD